MMPSELKELLRERADQVHLNGDFAPSAILGARKVRTRRAVTVVVAAALAVAVPVGLTARDDGVSRGTPSQTVPASRHPVTAPAPAPHTAVIRLEASEGDIPVPYIEGGVLRLSGRQIPVAVGPEDRLLFFATLSNGGVAYQLAGPNPDAPDFEAGPVTFLDMKGKLVSEHELTHVDITGPGDIVTGLDPSGAHIALDVTGEVLGRFTSDTIVPPLAPRLKDSVGDRVAVQMAGPDPYLWLGDLATGRSFTLEDLAGSAYEGLAVDQGRSLVVQGKAGFFPGSECKVLVNYRTGQRLRSWCDRERMPRGFFPSGDWMYGTFEHTPGIWVERTDDGARVLDIRGDAAEVDGLWGSPTADGTALIVGIFTKDGNALAALCRVPVGDCHVVGDGQPTPVRQFALPQNW